MPLEDEKIEELLSGLIDGCLTDAERVAVEQALDSDAQLRMQLEQLKQNREDLGLLAAISEKKSAEKLSQRLPVDFSERVLSAAFREADALQLSADHHVRRAQLAPVVQPMSGYHASWRRVAVWAGPIGVLACVVLLAVIFARLLQPDVPGVPSEQLAGNETKEQGELANLAERNADLGNNGSLGELDFGQASEDVPGASAVDVGVRYVGDTEFRISFALIVDIQVTRQSFENRALGSLFSLSNIPVDAPILADSSIRQALSQSRMIVAPGEQVQTNDLVLYFVRADMRAIDEVLQAIWRDQESFPNVALDIAFDTPRTDLLRRIARGTGERYRLDDSFAAAVSPELPRSNGGAHEAVPSPFPGAITSGGAKYVSRADRDDPSMLDLDRISTEGRGTLASVLVVVHIVD